MYSGVSGDRIACAPESVAGLGAALGAGGKGLVGKGLYLQFELHQLSFACTMSVASAELHAANVPTVNAF